MVRLAFGLLAVLGQLSLAQDQGVAASSSLLGFSPTFDSAGAEDPTASMVFVEPDISIPCSVQPFQSFLVNQNPTIVYLASFVSDAEAQHLIQQRFAPTVSS